MNIKPTFTEFGGRPLTSTELVEILDIERRRERLAWLRRMILALIIGAIVVVLCVLGYKRYSENLVMEELMYAPENLSDTYQSYCDIEFYNSVSGTDFATILDLGDSDAVFMSYYERLNMNLDIISNFGSEWMQYEPEYTFEQFCEIIAQMETAKRAEVYERTAGPRRNIAVTAAVFGAVELLLLVLLLLCPGALYLSRQELACRTGRLWIFYGRSFDRYILKGDTVYQKKYLFPRCSVIFCAGTPDATEYEYEEELPEKILSEELSDGGPYIRQDAKIRRNLFTIAERRKIIDDVMLPVLIVMVKGRIKLYPQ